MRNYFIGWSQAELETALRTAQEDLANGAQLTQGGAGDQTFQQESKAALEARIANIYVALFALDPITYPAAHCNPTSRTLGVFRDQ